MGVSDVLLFGHRLGEGCVYTLEYDYLYTSFYNTLLLRPTSPMLKKWGNIRRKPAPQSHNNQHFRFGI
jgi:hypothetical protein